MSYRDKLSACIRILKLSYTDAAEKIGISPNTLYNILNNRTEPSEDSQKKISIFLEKNDFSEEDLQKFEKIFQNLRIRSSKELSGIEKAKFREDFLEFMNILQKSDSDKMKWIKYFEYCDRPTDETSEETFWDRRANLLEKLSLNKKLDLYNIICECYKDFSNWHVMFDSYNPVNITFLLDSLGIRRFFLSFRTEKISSFSTSLESEYLSQSSEENPVIVINTRICNTTEKCLIEMAKQFYYMISCPDEYTFLSINKIQIEDFDKEKNAIEFAEKILINPTELNKYIQRKKPFFPSIQPINKRHSDFFFNNYDFTSVVNEIKWGFNVGYELAIRKLFETDFEYLVYFNNIEHAIEFYFTCLKRHDEKYHQKTVYLNGEPEPLPAAFRGYDSTIATTNYINNEKS